MNQAMISTSGNGVRSVIGAIIGDIVGSAYEWHNTKDYDFNFFSEKTEFTDDTVLSVATADVILKKYDTATAEDYAEMYKKYGRDYPRRGYGGRFIGWLQRSDMPRLDSYGNGSAMRVSAAGFAFDTLEAVLKESRKSAEFTHGHPEGVKGAQATASAIFLARTGSSKEEIKGYIKKEFNYSLDRTLNEIRPTYTFDATCPGSVPEAITAFLESGSYEDAIRKAITLGGDSDTIACIAGGIAEAFYRKIPDAYMKKALDILDRPLRSVVEKFEEKYGLDTENRASPSDR
ncbi:MAG: ADP-ribosylglycohydrolase family protein [Synergistaceae bacterium]|jgi:ADP-ribosylglycohydrolase|nr:ADP-ribosylglycohydrolase family protein [Synergistaceae bacterium]